MGSVTVTEEAVAKLNEYSSIIRESNAEIKEECDSLARIFDENKDSLGAHSDSIDALIEEARRIAAEASDTMRNLSLKLTKAAAIRKAHLELDRYSGKSSVGTPSPEASFARDVEGLRGTMDIGPGSAGVQQLSGAHKDVQKQEDSGYESHHIPAQSVLKEYGVDTNEWPTIALTKEDHAKTDSYRGKQKHKTEYIFGGGSTDTYKKEAIDLMNRPGGFFDLVRDEVLNIKAACGDKYDGAIDQYLKRIVEYVQKHGVPTKKLNT